MKNDKLEEIIKECGYKMPTNEFIKRFKEHEPTKQKIYYYLRKNKLPTYREWKRQEDEFEIGIISKAKERIEEVRKEKGEI